MSPAPGLGFHFLCGLRKALVLSTSKMPWEGQIGLRRMFSLTRCTNLVVQNRVHVGSMNGGLWPDEQRKFFVDSYGEEA